MERPNVVSDMVEQLNLILGRRVRVHTRTDPRISCFAQAKGELKKSDHGYYYVTGKDGGSVSFLPEMVIDIVTLPSDAGGIDHDIRINPSWTK